VDEPEQALHPTGIEHLLGGLEAYAENLGGPVILATHSPHILSHPTGHRFHVVRDLENRAQIVDFPTSRSDDLELTASSLGMRPIDLLQQYRVFLVVEGLHDSTVLEAIFPGEWESHRIRFAHMRGTFHVLDIPGSEILRDLSEAQLVVLMDDVFEGFVDGISSALALAMDGRTKEGTTTLRALEKRAGHAERKAVELAIKTINVARNYLDRPQNIHIRGLARKDIIDYLDPEVFGLEEDWLSLRKQRNALPDRNRGKDFKGWLRKAHGARINLETIHAAAEKLADQPPPEFTDLLNFCIDLSTGIRPDTTAREE